MPPNMASIMSNMNHQQQFNPTMMTRPSNLVSSFSQMQHPNFVQGLSGMHPSLPSSGSSGNTAPSLPNNSGIISFPHLSQIQQSTPTNKNIHDELISHNSGNSSVDQSAISTQEVQSQNPQSPNPLSGSNSNAQAAISQGGSLRTIQGQANGNMTTAIATTSPNNMLAAPGGKATYIDITPYLNMPQKEAARRLSIPTSTLSKRWKEAVRCRKWPYRTICKLDKEIMALLQNIPQDYNTRTNQLPEEIETTLGYLLRKRQEELAPVIIRI